MHAWFHEALRSLIAAAWLLVAGSAAAEPITWKMQCLGQEGSLPLAQFRAFAERLEAASAGRLAIEVLPAGAVVPSSETPAAIAAGLLQGHYNAPAFFAAADPAFALLGDTGAAYLDPVQRDGWFKEGGGLALARQVYARHGLMLIGPLYWPAEWLPSAVPLAQPADLAGLLVRAPEGLVGDLLRAAGAQVVPLPGGSVADALENGEIDAADWSTLGQNWSSGLYRAGRHNIMLRHSMTVTELTVGTASWAALPQDLKNLVEHEVAAFSERLRAAFQAEEAALAPKLEALGVGTLVWDQAAAGEFRRLMVEVWQSWRARDAASAQIIDSQIAYLQKLGLL